MRRRVSAILALSLLMSSCPMTRAQNPVDVRTAQQRAQAIHETSMREIAQATRLPPSYIASFLPRGANAGKKLSEQSDLSAKQYRAVRRLIAQRNYAIRETYSSLGLVVPSNTAVSFL